MSIGEVLGQLRPEFPDVTISKIRFLEDEGLVKPERTSSGYRKFSAEDVARLRYVLSMQRDRYLPLRVIKQQLAALDRGEAVPDADAVAGGPTAAEAPGAGPPGAGAPAAAPAPDTRAGPASGVQTAGGDGLPGPQAFRPEPSELRLSRGELLDASGLSPEQLDQLQQSGLLRPRSGGTQYDGDALMIARTVAAMGRFGIEARHLRPFKAAADREVGLIEQVVVPLARGRGPEARARADEAVNELAALSVRLHTCLVRQGLGPGLRR